MDWTSLRKGGLDRSRSWLRDAASRLAGPEEVVRDKGREVVVLEPVTVRDPPMVDVMAAPSREVMVSPVSTLAARQMTASVRALQSGLLLLDEGDVAGACDRAYRAAFHACRASILHQDPSMRILAPSMQDTVIGMVRVQMKDRSGGQDAYLSLVALRELAEAIDGDRIPSAQDARSALEMSVQLVEACASHVGFGKDVA